MVVAIDNKPLRVALGEWPVTAPGVGKQKPKPRDPSDPA